MMNNTDFFNDNRAEALKLICEHLHPDADVEEYLFNQDPLGRVVLRRDAKEPCFFNPCATTTEGKAQRMDVQDAYIAKLDDMPADTGLTEYVNSRINSNYILLRAIKSPEALCIAMLDLIRKED